MMEGKMEANVLGNKIFHSDGLWENKLQDYQNGVGFL